MPDYLAFRRVYSNDLLHFGIKRRSGRYPWGSGNRPFQSEDGRPGYNELKDQKTSNIEKWGIDRDHNLLYVTGYSGSGKSTIANKLAEGNTNVIHLDRFLEPIITDNDDVEIVFDDDDMEFMDYLRKNFPDYKDLTKVKGHKSKTWHKKANRFMLEAEEFSREQYDKGKKVVMEGIQLIDIDTDFLRGKSIVIMNTGKVRSFVRANLRDQTNVKKILKEIDEYIRWYNDIGKAMDELSKTTEAEKGFQYLKQYY